MMGKSTLHPGTAIYLGYTDREENLALDPTTPPILRRTGSPNTPTGRQVFVKVSYLFRFWHDAERKVVTTHPPGFCITAESKGLRVQ